MLRINYLWEKLVILATTKKRGGSLMNFIIAVSEFEIIQHLSSSQHFAPTASFHGRQWCELITDIDSAMVEINWFLVPPWASLSLVGWWAPIILAKFDQFCFTGTVSLLLFVRQEKERLRKQLIIAILFFWLQVSLFIKEIKN